MERTKVIHLNADFMSRGLYNDLNAKQINIGIDIINYVPQYKGSMKHENTSYTTIYDECFNKHDRYFFTYKQHKILTSLQEKCDILSCDIVHAHFLFTNGYTAMKLKEKYGKPYIVAVRNTDINDFYRLRPNLRKIGSDILRNADRIVFLSERYKDYLLGKYISNDLKNEICEKSIIIPNGINDLWLTSKPSTHIKPKDKIKVIYAGEINKNKNILTTCKALEILQHRNWSVEFTIAGKISDKNIFRKIQEKDYIRYLGILSREELIEEYKTQDIFVMPSKFETFGLVYAEAISQGLPIIYSRGQGFDGNFLQGEVGYNVKYNDYLEIADGIEKIVADYDLISQRCVWGSKQFNWEIIAQKYAQVYLDVIKEKNQIMDRGV